MTTPGYGIYEWYGEPFTEMSPARRRALAKIDAHRIRRGHWEVLTLEESSDKLLAARTISRADFENVLRAKLESP